MKYRFMPKGVCSRQIEFELNDGKISCVSFCGGCNGNLKAIAKLIEGMEADAVVALLAGNTCGHKETSCADQLTIAIREAQQKQKKAG
jgi:uncharacterized protein (TIGR03905 family)